MNLSGIGKVGLVVLVALALVWASFLVVVGRQNTDVSRRLSALETGQKDVLKQLQDIKGLLRQPAPGQVPVAPPSLPSAPIAIAGAAIRGNPAARLVIVEFSDFQCPYCGRYTRETLNQIERDYVDTGKVRYVFRNFPLDRIHPNAFKAAEAGECARQQGMFWEMHTRLFANQQALADNDLLAYAKAAGLDARTFQSCVASGPVAARIRQDLDDGGRAGVTGTPTMFVGTVQKDGQLHVLRRVVGAVAYSSVKATIDALLASPEVTR